MSQYLDDRNLAARQRLWSEQRPAFDLVGWVLALAAPGPGARVLDAGSGNGRYLSRLRGIGALAIGCDLSLGMLRSVDFPALCVAADLVALPFGEASFDCALAAHVLYHVPDQTAAARELRRVTRPGGCCVAVTNGEMHLRSLRQLLEEVVREDVPQWRLQSESMQSFSLENGAASLGAAFDSVTCVRPDRLPTVSIRDPGIVAGYVASLADPYAQETGLPWPQVVESVRRRVQSVIDREGAFGVVGDLGAFICH